MTATTEPGYPRYYVSRTWGRDYTSGTYIKAVFSSEQRTNWLNEYPDDIEVLIVDPRALPVAEAYDPNGYDDDEDWVVFVPGHRQWSRTFVEKHAPAFFAAYYYFKTRPASPPVDEAKVKQVADVLRTTEVWGKSDMSAYDLATELVKGGWTVSKEEED